MTEHRDTFRTLATNLVHAGAPRPPIEGAVVTPIFQSANYLMADEASYDAVRYVRLHNSPNHHTLHARLAAIESGEAALVTASGMAAITAAILAFVGQGEHLLVQKTLYGGTQNFLDEDAPRLGLEVSAIDLADPQGAAAWERALRPETRMLYVEAISNPLIEVFDLEAVVEFARAHDLVTLIDATFASPVVFRPLEIGFDIVVHSATKYLNGHSDLVAGAVVSDAETVDRIRHLQLHLGAALDPHACYLLERGLKTLALRVERQCATALALAERLARHPKVRRVNYPGLAGDSGHAVARRLFRGFGGMLSFYVDSAATAEQFLERVRIPLHAASLGGVESLVVRPSRSSHLGMPVEDRRRLGITDELIRVSTGIEDTDELIEDFERALG
ncbi:MAG: aminotransferase class I/II-fold pyridoxal phosphate-dependent enzyme [Thermoanaerobaculia bacterium]|nr:aminotransferase class I/II-fold pyridoxal phosphate-dependent enzyme [Thermoanaerobaculia bacterium]